MLDDEFDLDEIDFHTSFMEEARLVFWIAIATLVPVIAILALALTKGAS
jgi:hypothetical protein